MTVAAIIAVAAVMLAMLSLVAWLVHRADVRVDQSIAAAAIVDSTRQQLDAALLDAERAKFALAQVQQTLTSETARANALEAELGKEVTTNANADLAADDPLARVARMSAQWRAANLPGAAGQVPAVAVGEVRKDATTAAPVAVGLPKP